MLQSSNSELLTRRALSHDLLASGDMDATSAGYVITEVEELRSAMNDMTDHVFEIVRNPKKIDEEAYEVCAARVARMIARDKRTSEADAGSAEGEGETEAA